jgi:probable phosphoglycerate mutase
MVYTSPMSRCVDTGRAISDACHVPSETMEELNDIDYGGWQSRTYVEMKKADPVRYAAWLATPHLVRFPDGESLQDLVARAANALRLMIERHSDDTVVLVGHDSTNRAMLLQVLDQPLSAYWRLSQDPCCLNEIDIGLEQTIVRQTNATAHPQSL